MKFFDRIKLAARFVAGGPQARYEGARRSVLRSLLPSSVQSARFDITQFTRFELLRKSRYFEKNNAICNRLADLFEQYTVGSHGITFTPASSDAAWNDRANAYWQDWQKFADLSSRASFGIVQGIVARSLFVDGEIFILLTAGDTGNPRIQLIEGHRVRTPSNQQEGNGIIDGIEIDERGRPVRYQVAIEDNFRTETYIPQDAENIIHVFEPGRAGQFRGIPMLYAVMNDLHDLDDLQMLEMQAAKQAAEVTEVIKTATGEMPTDDDLIRGTTRGTDAVERADYYKDVFGARARVLKHGDDYQQHHIERPTAATNGYWEYLTKKVCAGVGIPYELVLPSSMQGTSMRSVLDIANAYFRARSMSIADHLRRVYEYVIQTGIQQGKLPGQPADWYRCTAQPPRSINVDVGRNSAAMVAEWKSGMRTLRSTYAETGEDWREQLRQKAEEAAFVNSLADQYGVDRAEIMLLDPNEISANANANAAAADAKGQGGAA